MFIRKFGGNALAVSMRPRAELGRSPILTEEIQTRDGAVVQKGVGHARSRSCWIDRVHCNTEIMVCVYVKMMSGSDKPDIYVMLGDFLAEVVIN
jgi:hypothetical protein